MKTYQVILLIYVIGFIVFERLCQRWNVTLAGGSYSPSLITVAMLAWPIIVALALISILIDKLNKR